MTAAKELNRDQRRSRRKRDVRGATISITRFSKKALEAGRAEYPEDTRAERPKTRGECVGGVRPCPFVSCQYNLFLDVNDKNGAIKLNYPDLEPHEMGASCALDVADAVAHNGGGTLERVGALLNVTRERARQIENPLFRIIKQHAKRLREMVADEDRAPAPAPKRHLTIVR